MANKTSQLSGELSEVLGEAGELLSDLVSSRAAHTATDAAIGSLFQSLHSIKQRAAEDECTVALLAQCKSGKSTLLNALLGQLVLPSNNVPETARICRVRHAPDRAHPLLTYPSAGPANGGGSASAAAGPDGQQQQQVEIEGAAAVREHLRELNAAARGEASSAFAGRSPGTSSGSPRPAGPASALAAAAEAPLLISARVAALATAEQGGEGGPAASAAASGTRICLLDSPGPNEAGQDSLRHQVERLLEGVDAVLYLLDYTKLKTSDEASMLQRLHELNPALIRRLCHRLFFVVNKIDCAQTSEGMGEEETRSYVAALVTEQLGVPGFEVQAEQIFLVSARDALYARLVLAASPAPSEVEAFRRMAFGKGWRAVTGAEVIRQTADDMLAESGVPELEAGVLSFLASRASVLHLTALLDDADRLATQVHNLTRASSASLHQGLAQLQEESAALRGRLEATLGRFEEVECEVGELEGLVVDEVRARMGRLKCKLEDQITQALTPGRPPLAAPRGRWPAVWAKAKSLLGIGGGSASEEPGQEDLQMRLCELHSMVYQQVEDETKEFWGGLESTTNQRQRQLFAALNSHIAELSAAVEDEVSLSLKCTLEPADIRLKLPSAEQYHVNLQDLLQKGIQKEVTREEREVTEERVVYVKRTGGNSLCRMFTGDNLEWWEPTTESHTATREVERVRYHADLAGVQNYFIGVVTATTENSVKAVRHYVRAYLQERVLEARGVLQAYADQYTAAMVDALEVAQQGEDERKAALDAAEAHCAAATALLDRVQELQRRAEELLEGWAGGCSDGDTESVPPLSEGDHDAESDVEEPEEEEEEGEEAVQAAAAGQRRQKLPASFWGGLDSEEDEKDEPPALVDPRAASGPGGVPMWGGEDPQLFAFAADGTAGASAVAGASAWAAFGGVEDRTEVWREELEAEMQDQQGQTAAPGLVPAGPSDAEEEEAAEEGEEEMAAEEEGEEDAESMLSELPPGLATVEHSASSCGSAGWGSEDDQEEAAAEGWEGGEEVVVEEQAQEQEQIGMPPGLVDSDGSEADEEEGGQEEIGAPPGLVDSEGSEEEGEEGEEEEEDGPPALLDGGDSEGEAEAGSRGLPPLLDEVEDEGQAAGGRRGQFDRLRVSLWRSRSSSRAAEAAAAYAEARPAYADAAEFSCSSAGEEGEEDQDEEGSPLAEVPLHQTGAGSGSSQGSQQEAESEEEGSAAGAGSVGSSAGDDDWMLIAEEEAQEAAEEEPASEEEEEGK